MADASNVRHDTIVVPETMSSARPGAPSTLTGGYAAKFDKFPRHAELLSK
jgi:hypothetical protein